MKPNSLISVLLLGTLLCILYFENCNGSAVDKPVSAPAKVQDSVPLKAVTATVTENKKPGNNTISVVPSILSRNRRQTCHSREPPGHRCSNDCHCSRSRYCSSYGFCHERNRNGRGVNYDAGNEYDEAEYHG